jgi:hypothetical protein
LFALPFWHLLVSPRFFFKINVRTINVFENKIWGHIILRSITIFLIKKNFL